MESKRLPAGDPALQLPTPRPTPRPTLSLSPGPTSKPTPKRFKRLAPRNRLKDDPFVRAKAESSPFSALPDDVDVFDTPLAKKRSSQRKLLGSKNRKEEQPDDDELVSLLNNWDAFLTPEKPKRNAGHTEPRPGSKIAVRDSLFSSVNRPSKSHPQSSSSSMLGRTSHKPKSPQQSITETDSSRKRPRRATAEPTLKRSRPADEDFEDDSDGMPPLPKAKRTRLFSTPKKTGRQDPYARNPRPDTPASCTNGSSPLPKKKDVQTPHASNIGLRTPDASSTNSPSPATSRRGLKVLPSPKNVDHQRPHTGDLLPGTPASFAKSPSPVVPPGSITRELNTNPIDSVQPKRKRGAQEAGISSSRGELKRMKFAKPPTDKEIPRGKLNHKAEAPRRKPTAGKSMTKGKCTLVDLLEKLIVD
jgi:hypothetical protein